MRISTSLGLGIKTYFQFFSVHPDTGKETVLSGVSENIILTSGKNEFANRTWNTAVKVGTDSTPATAGQTDLQGFIAGTITVVETITGAQGTPPFFGWKRKRFRFPVGTTTENLNEVSLGWSALEGDNCASRALIVDVFGDRATISPLIDEYLDVVVEVRYYPPLVDVTGTVVFDSVTYDYIMRASSVTSKAGWADNIGLAFASLAVSVDSWSAYDDDIGTIEQDPDGLRTASDTSGDYTLAYQNNSYSITIGMSVGLNGWNSATNKLLRSLNIITTCGLYQIQFDSQSVPGFGPPKTISFTFDIQYTIGWGEVPDDWEVSPPSPYMTGDEVTHADVQWSSDIDTNTDEPGVLNWTLT